jgi:monofunctional biosynthetic peptidoglycan transglycosylase
MLRSLRRGLVAALLMVGGALLMYQLWMFGCVVWWIWFNPSTSAFMEDRLEILQARDPGAELKHRWVPYEKISVHLKRAVVASEDAKFVEHEGFDWEALQKAYENLFLSSKRTPWRKAQEAVITLMLEAVMSKRRILEIYLNVIEWGEGVFGAEAAARHYYRVGADALGPSQAAKLAAMVPNPRFYDRHRSTPWLEHKTGIILQRMPAAQLP